MVCAIGMSSSLIEQKTTKVAEEAGVPFEIQAIDVPEVGRWNFEENPVDIVLIAPQARFKKRSSNRPPAHTASSLKISILSPTA